MTTELQSHMITRGFAALFVAYALNSGVGSTASAQGSHADIEIGGGGLLRPAYQGSDSYEFGALPIFKLHALQISGLIDVGGPESGWTFGPSVKFQGARNESENVPLSGLGDVDRAYELGGKIGYRWEFARAFVEFRQGFGGHDGQVGTLGADLIAEPTQRLQLEAGPRLNFASNDYQRTYFGISAAQSVSSGLPAHAVAAGLTGVGVDAKARYELTPVWALTSQASYERLIGDAARSPIVQNGSPDQFTFGLGLSYRLKWNRGR